LRRRPGGLPRRGAPIGHHPAGAGGEGARCAAGGGARGAAAEGARRPAGGGLMPEQEVRTTRSFCRVCTSVCGILVDTVGEQVVRVRGDRDHPMSQGYTCVKGRALPAMHHHPRRIERPLLRTNGSLRPASWEACLDDLGTRLRDIIDRHGPAAVGIFFGSGLGMDAAGYRMAEALHRSIGTPARFSPLTIDGTAKVLAASLVGGFPGLSPQPDYHPARLLAS